MQLKAVPSMGWKPNHVYSIFRTEFYCRYRNSRRVICHNVQNLRAHKWFSIFDEIFLVQLENFSCHVPYIVDMANGPRWTDVMQLGVTQHKSRKQTPHTFMVHTTVIPFPGSAEAGIAICLGLEVG
jgi:hypothetical protein